MISKEGEQFIARREGCRLTAYQDVRGIWTIGYGETSGVTEGETWTQQQADAVFTARLDWFWNETVARLDVALNQHQCDACVSLAYNIGAEAFMGSGLRRYLEIGAPYLDMTIKNRFMAWSRPIVLLPRRQEEARLFLTGKYE